MVLYVTSFCGNEGTKFPQRVPEPGGRRGNSNFAEVWYVGNLSGIITIPGMVSIRERFDRSVHFGAALLGGNPSAKCEFF